MKALDVIVGRRGRLVFLRFDEYDSSFYFGFLI
jgi:hypothetical protein